MEGNSVVNRFSRSIYHEHLDEASFLYTQRLYLLDDPEFEWMDLERFEERFASHIYAAAAGGDGAIKLCTEKVHDDAGTLHAVARVFCRRRRFDGIRYILETTDPGDPEKVMAIGRALAADIPSDRVWDWLNVIISDFPEFVQVTAHTAFYRHINFCDILAPNLYGETGPDALRMIVRASGRSKPIMFEKRRLTGFLISALEHDDSEIRKEAAIALLRLDDTDILDLCRKHTGAEIWPLIPLCLGGNRQDIPLLLDVAGLHSSPDCFIALGLFGDTGAIPLMIYHLDKENGQFAAEALQLITGAGLFEKVLLPPKFDIRELFDDELEQYKKDGTLPDYIRGKTITRISRDPETWQAWWKGNEKLFDPALRYRFGKPHSPLVLLECLAHPKTPRIIRDLTAEELAIRYGTSVPFETDMFVEEQRQALKQMRGLLT